MKKIILINLLIGIFLIPYSFSQTNPRMENPNYAKTIFYDNFDSSQLNRNIWNVSAHGIREGTDHLKLFIWVDSVATVNQSGGNLNLSMLSYPSYTTTDWDGDTITANFIAGQIETRQYFSYGVFAASTELRINLIEIVFSKL